MIQQIIMVLAASPRVLSPRVLSVDVLRGVTIAFMILVNDPGDWTHVYRELNHAEWSGWTLTDLVFPTFLFLIGASIIFSVHSRLARGVARSALTAHMVRRAIILFLIALFINAYPYFHLTHVRFFGVLTRIALCYLAAGLICLATRRISHLAVITVALLVGYWALMRFVPVPGFGIPTHDMPLLDHDRNLTAVIDRSFNDFTHRYLHTGYLYRRTNDPEGFLSTLPAIATTLLGSIAALFMRDPARTPEAKRNTFALAGVLSIAAGELWNLSFPFNKNLWTSSYVLLAAGIALLGLALFYWLIDIEQLQNSPRGRAALWPWLVFGSNSIVAFCSSELLAETLTWIRVSSAGKSTTLMGWIYIHGFSHGHSTELTSLAFAIVYVLVCFIPSWLLWRKQIFIRI